LHAHTAIFGPGLPRAAEPRCEPLACALRIRAWWCGAGLPGGPRPRGPGRQPVRPPWFVACLCGRPASAGDLAEGPGGVKRAFYGGRAGQCGAGAVDRLLPVRVKVDGQVLAYAL
jgi:hypothetical protein